MASVNAALRNQDEDFHLINREYLSLEMSRFTAVNLNWFRADGSNVLNSSSTTETIRRTPSGGWQEDFFGQDVSRFFYKWGGTFSSVLVRLRGRYDGDLDQFLLHLVFMLTELAGVNAANEAKAKGAATVIVRRRGLNALSLADITRIPRESVRRKLAALAERGLVEREEDGLYYLGAASDLDRFFYDLAPLFWDKTRP